MEVILDRKALKALDRINEPTRRRVEFAIDRLVHERLRAI
jgi:hypothetical protein